MFTQTDNSKAITVWGYGRASTDKQTLTPHVQGETVGKAVEAYKMLGHIHPDSRYAGFFCDEAVSSRVPFLERPNAMQIMLHAVSGDCIIVAKFDRMFRSVTDLCDTMKTLTERGIRLIMLDTQIDTSTINGMAMMQILGVIKWLDRETIRKNTKDALAYLRTSGRPVGGKSHPGYRVVHRIEGGKRRAYFVECPKDRALCELIVDWHDNKKMPFEEITLTLERKGYRQPKHHKRGEKPWTYLQVHSRYKACKNGYPIYGIKHDTLPVVPSGNTRQELEMARRFDAALADV